MIFNQENTLFLIVDIQDKLITASFNKNLILKNSEILAKTAQLLDIPTIITEQYPKGLGQTVETIKNNIDSAIYFEKTNFNAYADDVLITKLKDLNKKQIVVFGIETHICVLQTALALLDANYDVAIIKDASGSRAESEHQCSLSYLQNNGAHIITTEMLLFQLLKTSKHPKFKEIQALVK